MSRATITNMSCAPATSSTSMACRRRRPSHGRSRRLPIMARENVESTFRSCYAGEEEHGSVRLPRSAGGKGRRRQTRRTSRPRWEAIEAFLFSQAEFRHNVITHHCEIRWTEEAGFLPLTDRDVNTLWGADEQNGGTRLSDGYIQCDTFRVRPLFNPFPILFRPFAIMGRRERPYRRPGRYGACQKRPGGV